MERYYPFEHRETKENETAKFEEKENSEESLTSSQEKGKGRRDGNSAASVVIHSGKVTERAKLIAERKEREKNAENGRREYPFERSGQRNHQHYEKGPGRKSDERAFSSGKKERFDAASDLRGKRLKLMVQENTEFGSFLQTEDGKRILLPFSEQTEKPNPGDYVEVSIYEDKGGRLTATMRKPLISVGNTGVLTVAAVTKIGAFADNGMPKQVLIPFREMLHTPETGDQILVYLYLDKSGREAGTMRVYRHLKKESGYQKDDRVEGFVYEINPDLGVFIAVDDRYYGMIPKNEVFETLKYGDRVLARVSKVREDGKLDLLLREKLYSAADRDADTILNSIIENGGVLPFADKAEAELIKNKYSMSKNQFKRALGYLYKKRLIEIDREKDCVRYLGQIGGQKTEDF